MSTDLLEALGWFSVAMGTVVWITLFVRSQCDQSQRHVVIGGASTPKTDQVHNLRRDLMALQQRVERLEAARP